MYLSYDHTDLIKGTLKPVLSETRKVLYATVQYKYKWYGRYVSKDSHKGASQNNARVGVAYFYVIL